MPPFGAGNFAGAPELTGLPDGMLVPDPTTFRLLPWVEQTGWILSDAYFQNGREHPFSTRGVLRRQLAELATLGYDYVAGLEIEFYVFRLLDPNLRARAVRLSAGAADRERPRARLPVPDREPQRRDPRPAVGRCRSTPSGSGCRCSTIEDEWGAGQIEFTFAPENGMQAADHALLFRSAVKQVCRRLGYHATFMARPAFPDYFASGWHVHQSLAPRGGGAERLHRPVGRASG